MIISYTLLVLPLLILGLVGHFSGNPRLLRIGGVLGTSILFVLFGVLHFTATDLVVQMLPPWVPFREGIVLLTGVLEVACGVGLLVPAYRRSTAWACIAMLVLFYPANVYTHLAGVPVPGHGSLMEFLFVRTPLQPLMIVWTWWFALREPTT